MDLSGPVADRALFHLDNCYKWPSLRARGRIVRTHQASHTAFRGFGGPQVRAVGRDVLLVCVLYMDRWVIRQSGATHYVLTSHPPLTSDDNRAW